jgi:hypothetical protein
MNAFGKPMPLPGMSSGPPPKKVGTSVLTEGEKTYNLNRKVIEVEGKTLRGSVHQDCKLLWQASHGRFADTFIGITDLRTGTFYIYPMFTMKVRSEDTCTSIFFSDAPSKTLTEHRVAEVKAAYGEKAIIIDYAASIDGQGHQAACLKAQVSEAEALGWSIKGNCNHNIPFSIRFVSSRNNDKFEQRATSAPGKEARDMPKAWAIWIAEVLKNELNLKLEIPKEKIGILKRKPSFRNSRQPSGMDKSSKYLTFTVN